MREWLVGNTRDFPTFPLAPVAQLHFLAWHNQETGTITCTNLDSANQVGDFS